MVIRLKNVIIVRRIGAWGFAKYDVYIQLVPTCGYFIIRTLHVRVRTTVDHCCRVYIPKINTTRRQSIGTRRVFIIVYRRDRYSCSSLIQGNASGVRDVRHRSAAWKYPETLSPDRPTDRRGGFLLADHGRTRLTFNHCAVRLSTIHRKRKTIIITTHKHKVILFFFLRWNITEVKSKYLGLSNPRRTTRSLLSYSREQTSLKPAQCSIRGVNDG